MEFISNSYLRFGQRCISELQNCFATLNFEIVLNRDNNSKTTKGHTSMLCILKLFIVLIIVIFTADTAEMISFIIWLPNNIKLHSISGPRRTHWFTYTFTRCESNKRQSLGFASRIYTRSGWCSRTKLEQNTPSYSVLNELTVYTPSYGVISINAAIYRYYIWCHI